MLSCDDTFEVIFFGSFGSCLGLVYSSSHHFYLLDASRFLNLSLQLLFGLSPWISPQKNVQSSQSEVGFILDQLLMVVIGKTKSSRSVTTKSGSESIEEKVFDIPSILGGDESFEIGL